MYWALIMVSLWSPIEGVTIMDFGAYKTHEECIYNLRELEIHMSESEGAMCLLVDVDMNVFGDNTTADEMGYELQRLDVLPGGDSLGVTIEH